MKALIFDCDGVLVDTEKDGHRVAFNRAFKEKGLPHEWSPEKYHELLQVAGGKERMRFFFNEAGWPGGVCDRNEFIREMHKLKTELFMRIIDSGELELRPGVARLVDEAITEGITLAVCSTSNELAVNLIVERLLGPERRKFFKAILAGDIVANKKPDPEIYNLALKTLNMKPGECVVIEDSRVGLLAARAAGVACVVTTNYYTCREDTSEGDIVVSELGDYGQEKITIKTLKDLLNSK
jgi:HAD superfamily hydrolase (TIGR01509 family)